MNEIEPTNQDNVATQLELLRAHFLSGKSITCMWAIRLYGVGALPRRVMDLKAKGLPIKIEKIRVTKSNGKQAIVSNYFIETEIGLFEQINN